MYCEVSRAVLVRVITPQCCDVVRVAMHSCFGELRLVPLHRLSVPRSITTIMVVNVVMECVFVLLLLLQLRL